MKPDENTVLNELAARKIILLQEYKNYRTRRDFRCDKGHEWVCTAYDIIERQHTCPECGKNAYLDNNEIDSQVFDLNYIRKQSGGMRKREEIRRVGDYLGHYKKIKWQCVCCNWEWLSTPHDILFRGVGCPLCHVKSETIVLLALKDTLPAGTKIERQKFLTSFSDGSKTRSCKGDFFFELGGKKYLVEYNGQQHYEVVKFGSTMTNEQAESKFARQQVRDKVVLDYCNSNGIEVIVIDGRKIHGEKKVYEFIASWFSDKEGKGL